MASRRIAVPAAVIAAAVVFVPPFEGLRNDPYWDIARVRTVCYGHTGNVQERRYSTPECQGLLKQDLERHYEAVAGCLPLSTPAPSQVAFLSAAYNIGAQNFCSSSMARRLREGDLAGACAALSVWNKARVNGQLRPVAGLTKRRQAERELCERGLS